MKKQKQTTKKRMPCALSLAVVMIIVWDGYVLGCSATAGDLSLLYCFWEYWWEHHLAWCLHAAGMTLCGGIRIPERSARDTWCIWAKATKSLAYNLQGLLLLWTFPGIPKSSIQLILSHLHARQVLFCWATLWSPPLSSVFKKIFFSQNNFVCFC